MGATAGGQIASPAHARVPPTAATNTTSSSSTTTTTACKASSRAGEADGTSADAYAEQGVPCACVLSRAACSARSLPAVWTERAP